MKSRKVYVGIIILLMMIVSSGNVNAEESNNEEVKIGLEDTSKVYSLEDLINDKEEQKIIEDSIDLEEIQKEEEQKNLQNSIQQFTLKDEIQYDAKYNSTYVEGIDGKGFDWFIVDSTNSVNTHFSVYKHDIFKNTNTKVYDTKDYSTEPNAHYVAYYVRDNMLYIMYVKNYNFQAAWGTEYMKTYVLGIDTTTSKLTYVNKFNVPQNCTYRPSFAVDGEQRFYFVYRETGVRVFDKNANQLYDHAPIDDETGKYKIFIKGVSPNNKILFFETIYNAWENYDYYQSVYEGMQKLNNGVFTYKDAYTVYGREFGSIYSLNPRWHFLDSSGTYAADQYGRIAKFYYDVDSTMGVDREIVLNLNSGVTDYTYYKPEFPNVCKNGNTVYLMGSNNNIYKVDLATLKTSKYLETDIPSYESVYSMNFYEDTILMLYYYDWEYHMEQLSLSNESFTNIQNIIITESSTKNHTIAQIVQKYKQTKPTYNYNNSIYKVKPSWSNPYSAGSLQDGVIKDGLNRLNYYRWLVGVDEISLNSEKMERSQKGAVIQKALNRITHTPSKPSDMPQDFYEEAYDGCNAKYEEGDIYSGNCSYGDKYPYRAIEGYVSDLNNITFGSATGHRQSMLDPKATAISFGQCEEYSAASVYFDPDKQLNEKFYAFPSAGYFPNTEMKVNEYWSIYFTGEFSGTVSVRLTYNEKQYMATGLLFESGYPALSFRLPDELQNILGKGTMPAGTKIRVEVLGIKDENLNNVTYDYTVNFFDMASEFATPEQIADLIFDYKFYADKYPDLKAAYGYDRVALKNHYEKCGIKEGRQPSSVFDPKYYLYNNSDLKRVYGTKDYESAYNHFIKCGALELRPSSSEYYGEYYKENNWDLADFSAYNLLKHYINNGRKEGRKATNVIDMTPIDITPYMFDSTVYCEVNRDLNRVYGHNESALKHHWEVSGIKEGRMASLVFDAKFYLNKYADLKRAFGNDYKKAYEHFITSGIQEGRQGSEYFDVKYYLSSRSDLKKVYGENYTQLLKHFVKCGIKEGRTGSSSFKLSTYKSNYADLRRTFGDNNLLYYIHYISSGKKEGRKAI